LLQPRSEESATNPLKLDHLMAPTLEAAKHDLLRDLILEAKLSTSDIAKLVKCSKPTVNLARSNLRCYESTKAPFGGGGRRSKILPPVRMALREHLLNDPTLRQKDLIPFLKERYGIDATPSVITRALQTVGQPKIKARQGAGGNAKITPLIKLALHEKLLETPTLHHKDLVFFLKERYGIEVTKATVCRALQKFRAQHADEKSADLGV
jgi:arginine repressor